jgi:hypothetical protein
MAQTLELASSVCTFAAFGNVKACLRAGHVIQHARFAEQLTARADCLKRHTTKACSVLGLCYVHAARTSCITPITRVTCASAIPASCIGHAACLMLGRSLFCACLLRTRSTRAVAHMSSCCHAESMLAHHGKAMSHFALHLAHLLLSHERTQLLPSSLQRESRIAARIVLGMHLRCCPSGCTPAR